MSETTDEAGPHYVFDINEDDDQTFKKMIARNAKRYIDRRIVKGIPLACLLCLGGALIIAMLWDVLSPDAVFTGEASFALGFYSLLVAGRIAAPNIHKNMFRETSPANRHFDCAFGADGIVVRIGLCETRLPWRAISGVEDAPDMMIFWYQPTERFFIPRRAFSDDAARIAFAAWAAARVQAASDPGVNS